MDALPTAPLTAPAERKGYCERQAQSIGGIAYGVLCQDQTASILGCSSQGVFVRTSSRWVVFLSFEAYRSPLTISLAETPNPLRHLMPGSPVQIAGGRMMIPSAGASISVPKHAVWRHPAPPGGPRPPPDRLASLRHLAQATVAHKKGLGFSSLLSPLLDLPTSGLLNQEAGAILPNLLSLRRTLTDANACRAVQLASALLGVGRGLTPSGDDVVVGLLLVLNRWRHPGWAEDELRRLNGCVVEAAYRQTTRLSANLIECAASGESDERLMHLVDGILTGTPPMAGCVSHLLGWGGSSGADALVGMAIALTC